MKTNVCLIAPTPPPIGGIANWVSIITSYQQDDVEFFLIDSKNSINPAKKRTLINRIFGSGKVLLKIKKQLKKIIKTKKIDCVHITTSGSLGLIRDLKVAKICRKYNVKFVLHTHFGRIPEIIDNNTREWKLMQKVIKLASNVITIDSKTYNKLKEHYSNITYIPNPINPIPDNKEKGLKKIMYIGWIVKTKGVEELIAAWNNVSSKYQDWKLELVGPYNDKYLESLNYKDNASITFLGELNHDKAMKKMKESSIFVLPSYTEGFPNVILEAMMYKKAIIATNVGAIPEMLGDDAGLLIEKKQIKELENALCTLIEDEEKRRVFGENAYKRVNANYITEIIFAKLEQVWKKAGDL